MTGVCQKQGHEERYTNGRCAECDRERSRARYAANKQQYKENCKAWRAEACEQWVHERLDRNKVVHPDHAYRYDKWGD